MGRELLEQVSLEQVSLERELLELLERELLELLERMSLERRMSLAHGYGRCRA